MKANSRIYKGIEFIQISDLPFEQQSSILASIEEECIIKILVDNKIINNCIQYKDYCRWFDTVFMPEVPAARIERAVSVGAIQIAIGKA